MAINEKDFIELDMQYHSGFALDFYKGISLVSARAGKDGNIWAEWAFPQDRDKKPKEKAVPVKVFLGDDEEEAIENLRKVAMILKDRQRQNKEAF